MDKSQSPATFTNTLMYSQRPITLVTVLGTEGLLPPSKVREHTVNFILAAGLLDPPTDPPTDPPADPTTNSSEREEVQQTVWEAMCRARIALTAYAYLDQFDDNRGLTATGN